MWVYRITNIVNWKCYVGVTRNLEKDGVLTDLL